MAGAHAKDASRSRDWLGVSSYPEHVQPMLAVIGTSPPSAIVPSANRRGIAGAAGTLQLPCSVKSWAPVPRFT